MTDYDAIVIGAGNGGLTAATSLARAGVKTLLLEQHNIPGGCATSFIRGRFEFEVALHQLSGLGTEDFPGPLRSVLSDLGVMEKLEFVQMENLYRIINPGQLDCTLSANRVELTKTLKEQFPKEADNIDRFFDFLYEFCNQWISITMMHDPESSAEKYPVYFKNALKMTNEIFNEFFTDPLLQTAIGIYWCYVGLPPSKLPFADFAVVLWAYIEFKPWHVKGGSQAISNALLDGFLEAGGEVRFNCKVKQIKTMDGNVSAVSTEDGDEISTQHVVSNAGTHTTYTELLDREVVPTSKIQELGARSFGTSFVTLYMGFDKEPQEMGIKDTTNFITRSLDIDHAWAEAKTLNPAQSMLFSCYDVDDPDFSPKGASQAALVAMAYSDPWLTIPPAQYAETKYKYAQQLLDIVYSVFPGCKGHIEEIDVATPLTHMRYLGHPGGAVYGFDPYAKDSELFMKKSSPIKGLYHVGAWNGMGGFQPTLASGHSAARRVIRTIRG